MSTAPAPAVTVSFTTAEGFGSRDRITSPKPTARARPPANVVAMAAAVNTAVLRRGCGPAASKSSVMIRDGFTESGSAMRMMARTSFVAA